MQHAVSTTLLLLGLGLTGQLGTAPLGAQSRPAGGQAGDAGNPPLRLDHVPIAVRDLDAARATWARLGFSFKPGHAHRNGIENLHIRLAGGGALELITAGERRDALAGLYADLLEEGEQAAFLALHGGAIPSLSRRLLPFGRRLIQKLGRPVETLTFLAEDPLHYIFFVDTKSRAPDLPEHLRHDNGARALDAVWLAADDLEAEARLLETLGAEPPVPFKLAGLGVRGHRVHLGGGGHVVLLPRRRFTGMPGPIVGLTVRVADLDAVGERLAGLAHLPSKRRASVLVPPDQTHGVWLEFVE